MSGLCPPTQPTRTQCIGDTASGQTWFDFWNCDACYNTYFDFIYASPGGTIWNKENWEQSQSDFVQIFNKYFGQGNKITVPGQDGYDTFQETINSVCLRLPGVCDIALTAFCEGQTTTPSCPNCNCGSNCSTREGIASNAGITNFCGCYAPLPTVPQSKEFIQSNPQCDPLCTRIDTIKLDDGMGNNLQCENSTCVIDNVSIQAASSTVGGTVNFNQICNQCVNGPCTCIISGVNLTETGDKVPQLQSEFNQFCGNNSQCLQIEPSGVDAPVDCQQALKSTGSDDNTSGNNRTIALIWIIFIVACVIIIIGLIIWSITRKHK